MRRILPFLLLFVTLGLVCWAQDNYERPHTSLSFGSDLQWMSNGIFPWGQSVVFTGDLTGYLPTPWSWGLGLGLASGLSTSGYTGTALIYRSTLNLTALPQVYWDFYQSDALKLRLSAGPSISTWLFPNEQSFTHSQGLRLELQGSWKETVLNRTMILSIPVSSYSLVDGSTVYSVGLRAGFQLSGDALK